MKFNNWIKDRIPLWQLGILKKAIKEKHIINIVGEPTTGKTTLGNYLRRKKGLIVFEENFTPIKITTIFMTKQIENIMPIELED